MFVSLYGGKQISVGKTYTQFLIESNLHVQTQIYGEENLIIG